MSNYYYSGQGSLYAAERDPTTGAPKGFVAVGNIPELSIDIEITKFEHKESESGNRLLDLTVIKEKKGTFKFKLENLSIENLAMGLYGDTAAVVGATVASEALTAYSGKRCPLKFPKVSALTVTAPNAGASARVNSTPYTLGQYYTPAISNGHYYKCTIAGTSNASPPSFTTNGSTFADGTATFKDMGLTTKTVTTDYLVDATNGVITPVVGGGITDGEPLSVAYTYAGFTNLEAFTTAVSPERYLRFEGLNTIDGSFVIIDLYKATFNPLTSYGLINEELGSIDMSGSLLSDSFVTSGSKFFRQRKVT